jgi:putative hemolysin
MSELAIVSARPARLKLQADQDRAAPRSRSNSPAIRASSCPPHRSALPSSASSRVLSRDRAWGTCRRTPCRARPSPAVADEAGFALVIAITTYLSLVIGELVPKQLALRAAEPIAIVAARPMAMIATGAAPLVWLLDRSSALVLRLTGIARKDGQEVTTEELEMIFAEATRSGVIEEDERALMTSVMRLAERPVRDMMTPRTELHWIDVAADEAAIRTALAQCPHSLLLVAEGSVDTVVGVVRVRDVLQALVRGEAAELATLMKKPAIVPDRLDAMDACARSSRPK